MPRPLSSSIIKPRSVLKLQLHNSGHRTPIVNHINQTIYLTAPYSTRAQSSQTLLAKSPFASKPALAATGLVLAGIAYYSTMSSKLIPQKPEDVMVIRNITPNVVTLSVPFARFGTIQVGGRATIVRLTSGNLAVFSPVALTEPVKAKLAELGGTVAYIIAPDMEHHIFISTWAKAFPNSHIIGPAGMPEKRAKQNDEMIGNETFNTVFDGKTKLAQTVTPEFDADFQYEFVDAHPNKELVFFYKPDKIMIQADLIFNLPPTEQYSRVPKGAGPESQGVLARFFSNVQSTAGDAKGMKRLQWHLMSRSDRAGWDESMKRIDAWDFVTMIPCHGDTMEGNGKEVFRKVMDWHLNGKK